MRTAKAPWLRSVTSLGVVLLLAAILYAVFIGRTAFRVRGEPYFTLIDDAMISMRYAQHLSAGAGLVWNVGEPPVQGFTNLGWMLLMALLHLLPLRPAAISLCLMALSAAILLLNIVVVAQICRAISPEARHAPLIAAAITAFYFPLVFWSLRGMEVGLLVLLVDVAVLQCLKLHRGVVWDSIVLGLILGTAILVRMDALPQVAIILGYLVWARQARHVQIMVVLLVVGLALAGLLAFQYTYFGDLLPNTYYQKVVGASVAERLENGILAFNEHAARDVLMLALVAAAGVSFYRALRASEAALLAGLLLVQCLYSVWVGGDYAEPEVDAANRFITQGMPALIMLFSLTMDRILADILGGRQVVRGTRWHSVSMLSAMTAFAALLIISGTPWFKWAVDNAPLLKADVRRVRAGLAIAQATAPTATIAVHAAGQIPYYSGRRTIDLLGLNDPLIAKGPRSAAFYPGHDKWNYAYSIGQLQPDLIADNWVRLAEYIKARPEYRQLPNGMYMRADSTLVDEAALVRAYP